MTSSDTVVEVTDPVRCCGYEYVLNYDREEQRPQCRRCRGCCVLCGLLRQSWCEVLWCWCACGVFWTAFFLAIILMMTLFIYNSPDPARMAGGETSFGGIYSHVAQGIFFVIGVIIVPGLLIWGVLWLGSWCVRRIGVVWQNEVPREVQLVGRRQRSVF